MNAPQANSQFSSATTVVDQIVRCFDPIEVNAIINHPSVRPHVGGANHDPLDLTEFVRSPANYALRYEGFLALFHQKMPGLFEVHTQALPASRGKIVAEGAPAMAHWMFTRSNAIELFTRVPDENDAARELATENGFEFEFRREDGWMTPEGAQPVDWMRLSITNWMRGAEGLIERGQWFHREIEAACARAGVERKDHPEDENHDRYVGAAAEAIIHGQVAKGIHYYNRYAVMIGSPAIVLLSQAPVIIHVGDVALKVEGGSFDVVKSQ